MVALKYGLGSFSALLAGSLVTLLLAAEPAPSPAPVAIDAPDQVPTLDHEVLPGAVVALSSAVAPPAGGAVVAPPPPGPAPARAAPARDVSAAYRDWSSSVALLPKDLGKMGPSLKLALDNARNNDMAFCFRDVEGRPGPRTIQASNLMLYLQVRDGAVDVVEAQVAQPGDLPPAVVDCACEVLRGMEVKVFFTTPGQRYSYLYEIEA